MRPFVRHVTSLVSLAATLPVIALGAQSTRDRLPPKQGTVHVAPSPRPTPDRPDRFDHGDRDGDHDRDRDRDHDRDRDRHGGAVFYGGRGGSYVGYGAGWTGTGLRAAMYLPMQQRMRFALNDAAYVAVFEIQPGRGVRVVFPDDWAAERQLAAGYHEPPLPTGGDALAAMPGPAVAGTRFLYMVASDTPLGLAPEKRRVEALQALMGAMAFRSQSTWEVTDALRRRVLTLGGPGTWSESLVAYRPGVDDVAGAGSAAGVATVRCGNGVEYTVRAGERFECPR